VLRNGREEPSQVLGVSEKKMKRDAKMENTKKQKPSRGLIIMGEKGESSITKV